MRQTAYPEYKDSGIEWVGDVPTGWDIKPTFAVAEEELIKNTDGKEDTVLSLSYGNIVVRDVEQNFGLLPESFNTYQIVNSGNIVLRLTDLQNDKRSLRVGLAKQRGIITSAYLNLACKDDLDPSYAYRLLHSYDTTKVFYGMGGGLRQSMKFSDFRRLPIIVPPIKEQTQIANFLDRETTKIDTLIEKQQQLIKLLQEKRQAVISHAVTKGINPDAKMKDSGVEWLGEVPEHWKVSKVKYEYENLDSKRIPLSTEERGLMQGDYPYYGASGVIDGVDEFIFDEDLVLVSEDGANLLMRTYPISFAAYGKYWVNNHAHILRPKDAHTDFWAEVIEVRDLTPCISGAAQPKFTSEALGNLEIAIPTEEEEVVSIAKHIENTKTKYDKLIEKAILSVELMKERRTALISAAVTGKIDVRDAA